MWFWLCLFTWLGTRAPRLKGRAKTIKACPYRLMRPQETDRRGHGSTAPPPRAPALNSAPSTNQTVRGSGLRLGFNPRFKQETVLLFPGMGKWRLLGVFVHQPQQARYFDFILFSENVTFVDRGRPLFLRGFVISCPLAKCY